MRVRILFEFGEKSLCQLSMIAFVVYNRVRLTRSTNMRRRGYEKPTPHASRAAPLSPIALSYFRAKGAAQATRAIARA